MTGAIVLMLVGALALYGRMLVTAEQGHALVVSKPSGTTVCFGSAVVFPIVHRAEPIDIRAKTVVVDRRGPEGIVCRDGIRADVVMTFYLRVVPNAEDVLKVAGAIGCAHAGDPAVLEQLFAAKLSEALKTVAAHLEFEELHHERQRAKDEILSVIGADLGGFVLEDAAIDELRQTPIEHLDPNNVLDAQGIRKITERTTQENVRKRELDHEAERQLRRMQHELEELVIELERRKADALGRFRETTGRELTAEELRSRLEDGLRAMIERVLDERLGRA